MEPYTLTVGMLKLTFGEVGSLVGVSLADNPEITYHMTAPVFEVNGRSVAHFAFAACEKPRSLRNGIQEWKLRFTASIPEQLNLDLYIRGINGSPFIRFKYQLSSPEPAKLTKDCGQDTLRYFQITNADQVLQSAPDQKLTQIQLGHFNPAVHCYEPLEQTYRWDELYTGQYLTGPIVVIHNENQSLLLAYEHGADQPNAFLKFTLNQHTTAINCIAHNGNYYTNYPLNSDHGFESVWFELGLIAGDYGQLLPRYRQFLLNEISANNESRKPYIFYNTWNYQERNRHYNDRPYLESMNLDHTLAEIEAAHRLGIDVFVIDTGWYNKTGDWLVNMLRFPDGLQQVRVKLEEYGMKLGLWFNPIVAARTSTVMQNHPKYVVTHGDQPWDFGEVWETEQSYGVCLASGYVSHFVDTMIRLHDELGVCYFKWDGIDQYGCDSPLHDHGDESHTAQERRDCYAYEMGRRLIQIVEQVSEQRPDVIVDFDITEPHRFVGLGFLSVGKYFLVNNGPYFSDFDMSPAVKIEPYISNVFFYPGAARPRVCRQNVNYDRFIPSILFLTHYLPDSPVLSQQNSIASMLLGGNGIWGDLLSLTDEDIAVWSSNIADYKRVANAVNNSYPRTSGVIGSSPEIYEKLDPATASGIVVVFTIGQGAITHVTQPLNLPHDLEVKGADRWEALADGRIKLQINMTPNEARVVYFFGE